MIRYFWHPESDCVFTEDTKEGALLRLENGELIEIEREQYWQAVIEDDPDIRALV